VVDHQQIGLGGLSTGLMKKTGAVMIAPNPRTLIGLAANLFPHLKARHKSQLLARPFMGSRRPFQNRGKFTT